MKVKLHKRRSLTWNWPVWTVCRELCWLGQTAVFFLPEYWPTCFPKSPYPGPIWTQRHTADISSDGTIKGSSDQLDTHPDSSTTGAWSKPFSLRILMVFWQVTVGRTVSGAERFRPCTFKFHHLREAKEEKISQNIQKQISTIAKVIWWCTYHGLFTIMSSSLRKPFWTIHLSFRNLDLTNQNISTWSQLFSTSVSNKSHFIDL